VLDGIPAIIPCTAGVVGAATDPGVAGPEAASASVDRYQVLGVPPTASYAEVRDRYRRLPQRFHPDRLHGEPPEVRLGAERKMQVVTEAWGIIESDRRISRSDPHPNADNGSKWRTLSSKRCRRPLSKWRSSA